ncbi:MAG: hypothetical protein Q9209_002172 [Squamulea sp. 1 TL-2023]
MESIKILIAESNAEETKLHVLVTSLQQNRFINGESIEVLATREVIQSMVKKRISMPRSFRQRLRAKVANSVELQNKILDQVVSKANGMFLIADFHMKLSNQDSHPKETAYHIIAWMYFGRRTLNVDELRHALAMRPGDKCPDIEKLIEQDVILEICHGFVILEEHSHTIRLMHSTTREFLQKQHDRLLKHTATDLAKTCLTYLCIDDYQEKPCGFDSIALHMRLVKYPFLDYAAENWGFHANGDAEISCLTHINTFLFSSRSVANAHTVHPQVFHPSRRRFVGDDFKDLYPLRIAISFGLEHTARTLINHSTPSFEKKQLLISLLETLECGRSSVAEALLDAGVNRASAGNLPLTTMDQTFLYKGERPKTALDKSVFYDHDAAASLLVR